MGSHARKNIDGCDRANNGAGPERRRSAEDRKGGRYDAGGGGGGVRRASCPDAQAVHRRSGTGMSFPTQRPRRLRRTEALRGLVRETRLSAAGLIYPMFVCPGTNVRREVGSMPSVYQQSVDKIVEECREVEGLGLLGVILFGLPESKDARGSSSTSAQDRKSTRL